MSPLCLAVLFGVLASHEKYRIWILLGDDFWERFRIQNFLRSTMDTVHAPVFGGLWVFHRSSTRSWTSAPEVLSSGTNFWEGSDIEGYGVLAVGFGTECGTDYWKVDVLWGRSAVGAESGTDYWHAEHSLGMLIGTERCTNY